MHVKETNIKKIETKNILIDEKNYKDLVIYFTRYVHREPIKMLSQHNHELLEKIEEHEGNKYLMVDDCMLDKVSDKVKEIIDMDKFDHGKILIDMDDKLPEYFNLKNDTNDMCYKT